MAFLILDIETIPRPTIDESVEEVIAQNTQARVERTGNDSENAEYVMRDVEATHHLFEKLRQYIN